MLGKPIYYMNITISYNKIKGRIKRKEWIVTTEETAAGIMNNDRMAMNNLYSRIYGKSSVKNKKIIIVKINNKKEVGKTNGKIKGSIHQDSIS